MSDFVALRLRRHLGWVTENGTPRDLGFAPDVDLAGPYSFVPIPPNKTQDIDVPVDRLRDARWLWTRSDVRGAIEGPPIEARRAADRIVHVAKGVVYEAQQVTDVAEYNHGLNGFVLLKVTR